MPAGGYSEDALVEQPAMHLLGQLGWDTRCGYDERPGDGGPLERSTFTEVILVLVTDRRELAIFDLLTRPGPELTPDERETVKGTAKQLLDTITDKLVLDWRKRQRSRSAVSVAVGQALDSLPDAYDDDMFEEKRSVVFEHLLASFFDDGGSVYTN